MEGVSMVRTIDIHSEVLKCVNGIQLSTESSLGQDVPNSLPYHVVSLICLRVQFPSMRDGFVYIAFTIYRLAPLTSLYRFHYEYLQSHWLRDTESTRDDMASAWLQNERKIELVAMADEAGMKGYAFGETLQTEQS